MAAANVFVIWGLDKDWKYRWFFFFLKREFLSNDSISRHYLLEEHIY